MASPQEICNWLRIANTDGIGAITFSKLLRSYGSATEVINALEKSGKTIPPQSWAENEISNAARQNIKIILKQDEIYPQNMLSLRDAPPILYAKGNLSLLSLTPAVAIVGSRNASLNARQITSKIAFDLTEKHILVISGMARGIDSAAHLGALDALNHCGPTIAVLGTGVNVVYPPENKDLYQRIATQGLLLSEMPLDSSAVGSSFPRRNRIISALSNGVLVSEASEKSGSLITAHFAIEQNKTLFAIPGSPSDPRSAGPNRLLKAGAHMVENADDIIKVINTFPTNNSLKELPIFSDDLFTMPLDNSSKTTNIPTNRKLEIEEFLSTDAVNIDELIRVSGLDTATVMMQIVDLEMEGRIIRMPGNKIALNGKK